MCFRVKIFVSEIYISYPKQIATARCPDRCEFIVVGHILAGTARIFREMS